MEAHYADLSKKKFFPSLVEYMVSGPVCSMIWEGAGPLPPVELCSVPPDPRTPPPELSVVTSALMLAVTSSTDLMPSNLPTTRLLSGSPKLLTLTTGNTTPRTGSTNEYRNLKAIEMAKTNK